MHQCCQLNNKHFQIRSTSKSINSKKEKQPDDSDEYITKTSIDHIKIWFTFINSPLYVLFMLKYYMLYLLLSLKNCGHSAWHLGSTQSRPWNRVLSLFVCTRKKCVHIGPIQEGHRLYKQLRSRCLFSEYVTIIIIIIIITINH